MSNIKVITAPLDAINITPFILWLLLKGVMLVGLIEGVPYLKVERYTTQIFMMGNMVLDKRSLPLKIKKVFEFSLQF